MWYYYFKTLTFAMTKCSRTTWSTRPGSTMVQREHCYLILNWFNSFSTMNRSAQSYHLCICGDEGEGGVSIQAELIWQSGRWRLIRELLRLQWGLLYLRHLDLLRGNKPNDGYRHQHGIELQTKQLHTVRNQQELRRLVLMMLGLCSFDWFYELVPHKHTPTCQFPN